MPVRGPAAEFLDRTGEARAIRSERVEQGQQVQDESHAGRSRVARFDARPHEAVESKKRATKRVSAAVFGFREGQVALGVDAGEQLAQNLVVLAGHRGQGV